MWWWEYCPTAVNLERKSQTDVPVLCCCALKVVESRVMIATMVITRFLAMTCIPSSLHSVWWRIGARYPRAGFYMKCALVCLWINDQQFAGGERLYQAISWRLIGCLVAWPINDGERTNSIAIPPLIGYAQSGLANRMSSSLVITQLAGKGVRWSSGRMRLNLWTTAFWMITKTTHFTTIFKIIDRVVERKIEKPYNYSCMETISKRTVKEWTNDISPWNHRDVISLALSRMGAFTWPRRIDNSDSNYIVS